MPKTLHLSLQQSETSKKAVKLFIAIITASIIVFTALLATGIALTYFSAKTIKDNGPFKTIMISISIFMSISAGLISFYSLDNLTFKKLNKQLTESKKKKEETPEEHNVSYSPALKQHRQTVDADKSDVCNEKSFVKFQINIIFEEYEKAWQYLENDSTIFNGVLFTCLLKIYFTLNEKGEITKILQCINDDINKIGLLGYLFLLVNKNDFPLLQKNINFIKEKIGDCLLRTSKKNALKDPPEKEMTDLKNYIFQKFDSLLHQDN